MLTKPHRARNSILSVLLTVAMTLTTLPLTTTSVYAAATTYTVTSTTDASIGSGTSGTFRWCVEQANATSGTPTINFEFAAGASKTIMLYSPIEISTSMTINGNGAKITTYGMEGISWGTVRTKKDSSATVHIRRLRFSGCSLKTEGAALHNSAGNSMYVESCIFDGNHTNTSGGTGGAFANVGMAYVRGCTFYQNYASGTSGGGGGAIANYAYCEVYDNVFYGNYTTTNIAGKTIKAFSSAAGTLCYRNMYDDNEGGVNLVSPNDNYHSSVLTLNTEDFRPTDLLYQRLETWPRYYQYDFYGNDKTVLPPSIAQYAIGAVTIVAAKQPTITTQPYNGNQFRTFYSDQAPDSLSVQASSPDGATLSYQWYKNGSPVPGATSTTYAPPAPYKIGISNYYCRVTNRNPWSSAYVNSDTVPIIFKPCFPTVAWNGKDVVYTLGEAAALSVTASTRDDGDLTYQWWSNRTPGSNGATRISGANAAEYTPPTDEAGIMYYCCTVNNNSDALPNYTTGQTVPWVKITVVEDAYFRIGTVSYGALQSAVAAVQDGETIEMLRDVTLSDTAELNVSKTYTLDLGGYELTGDVEINDSLLQINAGNVTIKNGVLRNDSNYGIDVRSGARANILSGDYTARAAAVQCWPNGTVIITSGRFRETKTPGDGAFSGDGISLAESSTASVPQWKSASDVTVTAAPHVKTVSVGVQNTALAPGTVNTVTFPVTTTNIANGSYTVLVDNLPSGVTVQGQVTISGNAGTLTLAGDTSITTRVTASLTLTIDGVTSPAFTLTIAPVTYAFTPSAGTGGTVSGTTGGDYAQGMPITVTATANSGYHFKNWTASGVTLVSNTANPATFAMPANAVTLTANFEADGDNNGGNGGGGGGNGNNSGGDNGDGDKDGDKNPPKLTETPVGADKVPAADTPTAPGQTANLPGTIDFGDGTSADVAWTSGDTAIAKINADGNLVGVGEGKVVLTAVSKTDPTEKITIQVTIAKNVTKIRTPLTKLYLKKGKVLTPPVCADSVNAAGEPDTVAKLTWTSGNPEVAAVNAATGKITPKKKGTAKITATALNGKKMTLTVKVVAKAKAVKKVALVKPPKKLKVGKTAELKIKLTPPSATNAVVKFKSNRSKIIGIDKAGKITALKKGKAKITVSVGKKKHTITITVK